MKLTDILSDRDRTETTKAIALCEGLLDGLDGIGDDEIPVSLTPDLEAVRVAARAALLAAERFRDGHEGATFVEVAERMLIVTDLVRSAEAKVTT